jgi:hypothetical protein
MTRVISMIRLTGIVKDNALRYGEQAADTVLQLNRR